MELFRNNFAVGMFCNGGGKWLFKAEIRSVLEIWLANQTNLAMLILQLSNFDVQEGRLCQYQSMSDSFTVSLKVVST